MKIRKIAAITCLVLSSFAANSVAPSKSELEAMYDKAFREFDGNNYEQALKDLDAIDARQPDVAESQNLRGVIAMRQKDYPKAESALQKALAADPKFWNARFNLAEVPFLEKNWAEARKRFQELLNGNASELQGEATQLIQYKILITCLMEGKENMVEAIKSKFELSPDTPALQYTLASIALSKKDEQAAKDALTAAEKHFSPQLNKLFAESLYEVGWLEKPAGQTRAALELNSAAEKAAKSKEFSKAKYEQAEQALQQRDMTAARKLIDEADAADANQPAVINLRGEILLEQKEFDQAETEFRKAIKIDPKFRDAQYNLAQIPFKKKEYTKARERFESLFSTTSGVDKDRAAQLIKFKVYLTYLLEGKDSRAQKMMEQFQFTGDTPALYYAQAAWEFKHGNATKANDWVTSARKIYSSALNGVFSDSFFDLGWLQTPTAEASPGAGFAEATPADNAPAIEPTPIPAVTLAKNEQGKNAEPLTLANQANTAVPGMEATATTAAQSSPAASTALTAAASPKVETPVASTASPAAARPVVANATETESSPTNEEVVSANQPSGATAAASPATVLAPAKVREWSQPGLSETLTDRNTVLVGSLLLAGILLLAWVMIPELRRRFAKASAARALTPATSPSFVPANDEAVGEAEQFIVPKHVAGGPPQISLQLRASEPALRRAAMPLGKGTRASDHAAAAAPTESFAPKEVFAPEPPSVLPHEPIAYPDVAAVATAAALPLAEDSAPEAVAFSEGFVPNAASGVAAAEAVELEHVAPVDELPDFATMKESGPEAVAAEDSDEQVKLQAPTADATAIEDNLEPVGQGQPVPYLTSESPSPMFVKPETKAPHDPFLVADAAAAAVAGANALRHSLDKSQIAAQGASSEQPPQQSTQPVTMPQPTPTTPAPTIRTGPAAPTTGVPQPGQAPQPAPAMQPPAAAPQAVAQPAPGGMHTAVQLTFSFEIASLQLTPNFKMGALSLKPTSKIVTMRLAPSQHPQPAMNLQVTFEVATVQLSGNSIGMIRLTPSQQQRPGVTTSPSFNISGLQLVTGSDAAPVQLTPSQQGQASVHLTAGFQIATVEFSPSFEIASIILNATSKNASVQLPGTGPSAIEGAPVFEITNVQLGGNGEISMVQLNPPGAAPKRA